jgi:hypothetical protein
MSKNEIQSLLNVADKQADDKASARSRNHYGHEYTRLKMECHNQRIKIRNLEDEKMVLSEQTIKQCDRAYYGGAIVGVVVTLIGVAVVQMVWKGAW